MNSFVQIAWSNAFVATALALVVFCITRAYRKPALSHCLWILVLLKLVMPPVVSVPLPLSWVPGSGLEAARAAAPLEPLPLPTGGAPEPLAAISVAESEPTLEAGAAASARTNDPRASASSTRAGNGPTKASVEIGQEFGAPRVRPADVAMALLGAWMVGTVWVFAVTGLRVLRFQRALRVASAAPVFLRVEVEALAKKMGVRRRPRTLLVPGALSPMLWAPFGGATVLFPDKLLGRLGAEGRQTLLLHEVAHLRRRDHWVRVLETVVTALYWWHPVVWWARHEIQLAEEACCDSWVVSEMPDHRETYAGALVEAVRFLSGPRSMLPLPTSGSSFVAMKQRVTTIMLAESPRRLSFSGWILVTALAVVCLPLLLCPTSGCSEQREPGAIRRSLEAAERTATETAAAGQEADAATAPGAPASEPRLRPSEEPRDLDFGPATVESTSS
jgi:bla regulator protein BlaR1